MADDVEAMKRELLDQIPKENRFHAASALDRHLDGLVTKRFNETGQDSHIEPNSPEYKAFEKEELERFLEKARTDGVVLVMARIQQPTAVYELRNAIEELAKNPSLDALEKAENKRKSARALFEVEENPTEAFTKAYEAMSKDSKNTVDFARNTWKERNEVLIEELKNQGMNGDLSRIAKAIDRNGNGRVDTAEEEARISKIAEAVYGRLYGDIERDMLWGRDTENAITHIEAAIAKLKPSSSYSVAEADEVSLKSPPPVNNGKVESPTTGTPGGTK